MKDWLRSLTNNAKPDINECLAMLGGSIDWLGKMQETAQDPEWHDEGDVHTHVGMVLDALYDLLKTDARHITGWRRQALILGALLHDVGKTVCTKEIEIDQVTRIVSPKHEEAGRSYLAFKLMELPLSFKVIWAVLGLVGEHHMPKRLVVKNLEKRAYLALSRRVDIELLYWLEVADMRGKICLDLEQQMGYMDEFYMFAQEYDLWGQPYEIYAELKPYLSLEDKDSAAYIYAQALHDIENGSIYMPVEAVAKYYAHKANYAHLFIMCGPSGVGKSYWLKKHAAKFALVSLDQIREELNGDPRDQKNRGQVLQLARERLKISLRQQQNVAWDATNIRVDFRKIAGDIGRAYHALVTLVVFLAPKQRFIDGNQDCPHSVPADVLQKQFELYEFPTLDEAHRSIYVNDRGETLHRAGFLNAESLME